MHSAAVLRNPELCSNPAEAYVSLGKQVHLRNIAGGMSS